MTLQQAISSILARSGYTQSHLARLLGVSQSQLSRYVKEGQTPSPRVLLALYDLAEGAERPAIVGKLGFDPQRPLEESMGHVLDEAVAGGPSAMSRLQARVADAVGAAVAQLVREDELSGARLALLRAMVEGADLTDADFERARNALLRCGDSALEHPFLNLMRRFLDIADRDTIAIVESLAATRVGQHEREVQKRKEEGRKTG